MSLITLLELAAELKTTRKELCRIARKHNINRIYIESTSVRKQRNKTILQKQKRVAAINESDAEYIRRCRIPATDGKRTKYATNQLERSVKLKSEAIRICNQMGLRPTPLLLSRHLKISIATASALCAEIENWRSA